MIYIELRRPDRTIITSDLQDCPTLSRFEGREEENLVMGNSRNLFMRDAQGSTRIIAVDETAILSSSKIAKKVLQAMHESLAVYSRAEKRAFKKVDQLMKLVSHNLVESHALLKDKTERIFSEDVHRAGNYQDQRAAVRNAIVADVDAASDDFLQFSKRVDDFDAQLTAFSLLAGATQRMSPDLGSYNPKKTFLRHVQPFLSELRDRNVGLNFESTDRDFAQNRVQLDHKMINAALYHFFNNASKYTLSDSMIHMGVSSVGHKVLVKIAMKSVKIEEDELSKIYDRGVSGINAGDLAGDGLGMFVIKAALRHFGADMRTIRGSVVVAMERGLPYSDNEFVFEFDAD